MEEISKFKFKEKERPLLSSKVRAGVKPSKAYKFEGPPSKIDEYPISAVGFIRISIDGETVGHSTGSLIGPKLVLTAAHDCRSRSLNQKVDLEFVPSPIY